MAQTKVINTSGAEKYFGFLPQHGVTLDDNEEVTYDGDLRTILASGRNRYSGSRAVAALQDACDNGQLCLVEIAEDCCASSSAP
jgi:hypothetical protein